MKWEIKEFEISKDFASTLLRNAENNRIINWSNVWDMVDKIDGFQDIIYDDSDCIKIVAAKYNNDVLYGGIIIDGQHRLLALCLSLQESYVFKFDLCNE